MIRFFFPILCLIMVLSTGLNAQEIPGVEESGIVYRKMMQGGVGIHSRGLSLHFRRGQRVHAGKVFLFDFALQTIRHPKEVKSVSAFSNNNTGFLYGKVNSLNTLHTGAGFQRTLHQRSDVSSVAIGYSWFGGISWAMAKPVYLYILHYSEDEGIQERLERYNPDQHFPDQIAGRASWMKGVNKSRFYPGLYASFQFYVDLSKQETNVRMLEAGLAADAYPAAIRIMADQQPGQHLFFHFFIRFIFGKQWNHR